MTRSTPRPSLLRRLAPQLVVAGLLAPGAAAQTLWTVAADGTGDFTTIQGAIDAAAPGDAVLVTPSFGVPYAPFVATKGVSIHAPGAAIFLSPSAPGTPAPVQVRDLPPGETFVLSGIQIQAFDGSIEAALLLERCAGSVWIQDVFVDAYGTGALVVEDCDDVVVTRSLLQTNLVSPEPDGTVVPAPGALVVGSRFAAHDSEFRGSHGAFVLGGAPQPTTAFAGGSGIVLRGGSALLAGTGAFGGTGSALIQSTCAESGDGGDGLRLEPLGAELPEARLVDATLLAGMGSTTILPPCGALPLPGLPLVVVAGEVETAPGPARLLTVATEAQAGGAAGVGVTGAPGELAVLFAAASPAPVLDLLGLAVHLDPFAAVPVAQAEVPLGGTLSLALPVPPGLVDAVALQAVLLGPSGIHASGPGAVLVH